MAQTEEAMSTTAADTGTGWQVTGPAAGESPFVFACPHSGRDYPADLLARTALRAPRLRLSEDAYTDHLFAAAAEAAPMLYARIARAYIDLNRDARELDQHMFDARLAGEVLLTPRVAAGFGVVPRNVREGERLYTGKLPPGEATRRIAAYHHPYHAKLAALLEAAHARFGFAILVDCHSMPSGRPDLADVVLGDRFGAAAAPALMLLFERAFSAAGFAVTRNYPYAGGFATITYGQPQAGFHAVQIEINRALYLDEARVEPGPRFTEIQARVQTALMAVLAADAEALCRPALAAE